MLGLDGVRRALLLLLLLEVAVTRVSTREQPSTLSVDVVQQGMCCTRVWWATLPARALPGVWLAGWLVGLCFCVLVGWCLWFWVDSWLTYIVAFYSATL